MSRPARSTDSSDPTGPGSRRRSACCARCSRRRAGPRSVAGFDVVEQPGEVRLRIGAALQEAALDPRQTGTELLLLQGRLYGLSRADARRRVDELGELIDLGDALDRRIATYSGGMKRRLDLAAALIHNPDILFLDEPTTGLDPGEPGGGVGRGSPPQPRARDDGLPHDAVPRRGRRARRSRRHHRPAAGSSPRARPPT